MLDTRRDSGADTRLAELKSFLQPAAEELGVPLGVDADEFAVIIDTIDISYFINELIVCAGIVHRDYVRRQR